MKNSDSGNFFAIMDKQDGVVIELCGHEMIGEQRRACIYSNRDDAERMRAFLARQYPKLAKDYMVSQIVCARP